ncbi:MAG: radical SAM protein [bacterium]
MSSSTNSLLINYVSNLELLSGLIPDIGLATLAGALKANGHKVKIIDYATIDMIDRLEPTPELKLEYNAIVGPLAIYFQNNYPIPDDILKGFNYDKYLKLLESEKAERQIVLKEIIHELCKEIENSNIDFLGFKLWAGDAFEETLIIAEYLKAKFPNLKIFGGGPLVDWLKEIIFSKTHAFDIVVFGEGDETIVKLADYCLKKEKLENIPNIIFRNGAKIKINDSVIVENLEKNYKPCYSPEIYPALAGNNKLKVFMLEESRGCPYLCNFCAHPLKSGKKWRIKSADNITEEMESIIAHHNSNTFRFCGSSTPARLQTRIAKKIIEKGLQVRYSSFAHFQDYNKCNFELLSCAGCKSLLFGLESGSPKIQKHIMNKVIKIENAKKIIEECRRNKIQTVISIIYPAPKETIETMQMTIEALKHIRPDSVFTCIPVIVPYTKWFNYPEEYNIDIDSKIQYIEMISSYKPRYNGHPILWRSGVHRVNGLDYKQQTLKCGIMINELKKNNFYTQITEEEILFASVLGISAAELAYKYQKIRQDGDIIALWQLVTDINNNCK